MSLSETWGTVNELHDLFKILKSLSMTFFVTIPETVSSITSKSMWEAVDFCTDEKIFL